ncbi:MAG TPA: alpha/beta hydrolase [Ramlibacter sp.]|jgi:alpha-beta hydrolase superfamily lysophospholipase|uniref:dienelactone hydrolase family protein n=1 Tax=Ramlibacter sp. TaxID=1917967 RepID=UPI002D3FCDB8|nr:alpha/beta hydrolase [Ramlibacter sp.]HZY18426.1 alpha/beta hydrolase [Ramlibacter sp.]
MALPSTHAATEIRLPTGTVHLTGDLVLPPESRALVLFSHGSGSGRHSSRNRRVAAHLQAAGIGTLLLDLLTPAEEAVDARTGHLRFDIPLLSHRLLDAATWIGKEPQLAGSALGLFGASTGSAAALIAAAKLGPRVAAVVSRGGRPDLAGAAVLDAVTAPTLLIAGGNDAEVLALNRVALERLHCPRALEVVPGAGHLFEEPGTLDRVGALATAWFARHLLPQPVAA